MMESLDRRGFLKFAAGGLMVGTMVVLHGCSSSSDDDGGATTPTATHVDKSGEVGTNHGHAVTLTAAQQDAGQAVTLTLSSGQGHTHTLDLTADEVAAIAAGTTTTKKCSWDMAHEHTVTFN